MEPIPQPPEEPRYLVLKAIPIYAVAMSIVAVVSGLFYLLGGVGSRDALLVASTFLVATLAITAAIYQFQWNYFDKKGPAGKLVAAPRTRLVFIAELAYVVLATVALGVNSLSLLGVYPGGFALLFSWGTSLVFIVLIEEEIRSSIRHIDSL